MSNKTIIYYTGNTEDDVFEGKVRDNILKVKGDVPVVSVSQKPIDFGTNICVGDIGHNYRNAFAQVLVGCRWATTPFVMMAESDCLYPDGYFDFEPTDLDVVYTYDNVWLTWCRENRTRFYKHGTTAGSIVLGRKHYIDMLKNGLPDFANVTWETFTGRPLVNVKTRNGVSFGTALTKGVRPLQDLDGWGTVDNVRETYGLRY